MKRVHDALSSAVKCHLIMDFESFNDQISPLIFNRWLSLGTTQFYYKG